MAASAVNAVRSGATAIDINFGCPAPTVNRNDGGASLLRSPCRIRRVVEAVRQAVPPEIPVSAKLRLGWESVEDIHENAQMAAEGGASWITIHARTRMQGYTPPVYWKPIGRVRESLSIPVVANGDIWTIEAFEQCRQETGCRHFMIGRSALANPVLPLQIAVNLGLVPDLPIFSRSWQELLEEFDKVMLQSPGVAPNRRLVRMKQWLKLAASFGEFTRFDEVKRLESPDELLRILSMSPVATQ